jgi:DNA-binding Lrp family transcriptional regulator
VPRPCAAAEPRADELDAVELARQIAARGDLIRVAQRRSGELTNSYRERAWDGCTLPELPYYVYLARDGAYYRLAFDLDAARGDVQRDAATLRQLLTDAGIRFIEARSGPAGGRHLIVLFHAPLPAQLVAALARHLRDVHLPTLDPTCLSNPATGGIRPPGSPHRHGGRSMLLTPPAAAAAALAKGNGRDAFDRLCDLAGVPTPQADQSPERTARAPRPLSPRLQRLEREGDVEGAYRDRSAVAAAIALGYINAGLPFQRFLAAALDPACRGLDHLRRTHTGAQGYRIRSDADVRAAAERMWRRRVHLAERRPPSGRPAPAPGTEQLVAAVRAAADARPSRWGGQGGRSDRAVLDAFLDDARHWPHPEVPGSIRRLAERSGISRSAVGGALHRLADDGWLERCTSAVGPLAATYRPALPPPAAEYSPTGTKSVATMVVRSWVTSPAPTSIDHLTVTIAVQSHDVFTSEGLGRYAAAVFTALTEGSDTAAGIASRTGLSARTVRRHLRRLADAGLVSNTGPLWRARDLDALDRAAELLGVTGTAARRAETHAAERATYHWYVADFAARRGWTVERGLWRTGRHTMTGRDVRPAPSVAFPRRDGRADPTRALHLLLEGHGPASESVILTTPPQVSTIPPAASARPQRRSPHLWCPSLHNRTPACRR